LKYYGLTGKISTVTSRSVMTILIILETRSLSSKNQLLPL